VGAPVEFMWRDLIIKRFGEPGIRDYVPFHDRLGAISDDTQMTLFTAEGLLRGWVRLRERGIGPAYVATTAGAYLRWLNTQGEPRRRGALSEIDGWLITHQELFSRRAPGMTCVSALRSMKSLEERAVNDSKGCGGVMRVAPVGIFMAERIHRDNPDFAETFQLGADVAAITHGHPTGYLAAGALAVIIADVLCGATLDDAVSIAKDLLRKHERHEETLNAIERAEELSRSEPGSPAAVRKLGEGWIAEEALAISLYCALGARNFEDGVVLAVNQDGDSDSTGAIAGNLLGCVHGLSHIPQRWLKDLELREVIEEIADDLATTRLWKVGEGPPSSESEYYRQRYPPN
jgi:ADP-ribosylglycohydrolase